MWYTSFPRDPEQDLAQINSDKNCCICLEDFLDDDGNPISPPQDENEAQNPDQSEAQNSNQSGALTQNGNNRQEGQGHVNEAFQHSDKRNEFTWKVNEKNTSDPETGGKKQDPNDGPNDRKDLVLGLLRCGHVFHFECIWKWMQSRTKCPICRKFTNMSTDDIKAVSYEAVYSEKKRENKSGLTHLQSKSGRPGLRRNIYSIEEEMKRKSTRKTSVVGKIRERARSFGNKNKTSRDGDVACISSGKLDKKKNSENQGAFADNIIDMIRERASSFGSNKGFNEFKNDDENTEPPRSRLASFSNLMEKMRARANSAGSKDKDRYVINRANSNTSSNQSVTISLGSEEDVSRPRLTSFGTKGEVRKYEKITEEQS